MAIPIDSRTATYTNGTGTGTGTGHGYRNGHSNGRMNGKKNGRSNTSHSRLVEADSPIYALISQVQSYIHLPDPQPWYVMMGAVAGNMLTGNPIWLMLVGSSG